jgi:hypothetical protein
MMLFLSALMYTGALALVVSAIAVIRPMRRLGLGTRRRALILGIAGALACLSALYWPTPILRVAQVSSALDEVMPEYQFVEHHELQVRAEPAVVFGAIRPVTAREIRYFQTLTWIRNPRVRATQPSILAAPEDRPLIDVALGAGFRLLREDPGREIVIGTRVARDVTAVLNFRVTPDGPGASMLTTETRVFANSSRATRAFAAYWRVIYPGSAIIRIEWLRAIKRRAEIQSSAA